MKAEANARAANKKEFLDKMARMSAHVESLKVQRRCHSSTFSLESLVCSHRVWSLVPQAGMHGKKRHEHSAKRKAGVASRSQALLIPLAKPFPSTGALMLQLGLSGEPGDGREGVQGKRWSQGGFALTAVQGRSSRGQLESTM